jgi:hypothetical protein
MSSGTENDVSPDVWDGDIETEIGHDEYDPIGTLSLIAVYVLIIGLLWVFMYFVEFLGNGPTVV